MLCNDITVCFENFLLAPVTHYQAIKPMVVGGLLLKTLCYFGYLLDVTSPILLCVSRTSASGSHVGKHIIDCSLVFKPYMGRTFSLIV